jgi:hypothetical protein
LFVEPNANHSPERCTKHAWPEVMYR